MADPDDLSALMRLARAGQDEAYRRLLLRVALWLRPVVRRGLAQAGRGPEESEDIVQDTLLALHLKRDTWDPAQPVEPWLRAIARYKLVDHLRRRGLHGHLDLDSLAGTLAAPDGGDPGAALDSQRLLATLPARQRRIVEEIAIEGRRAAEVGARLGMTEGAVRVALHRALKALAAAFRQDRPDEDR